MRPYPLVALSDEHDASKFDCGEDSLTRYLRHEAHSAQASGEARTHIWVDGARVVAYFTVMLHDIADRELPRSARLKGHRTIPGYLLAKLALDQSLRGQALGKTLLIDSLASIVRAADAVGGRVIVVDSLEDNRVHAFYCSADFNEIPGSYRLWMKVATARDALGLGS